MTHSHGASPAARGAQGGPRGPIGKRIRSSALVSGADGTMRLDGAAFSGLCYGVGSDGAVVSLTRFENGVPAGASSDWLDPPPGGTRADRAFLEERSECGPLYLGGARFTGIVYDFDDHGACLQETEFVDGRSTEERERAWYASGIPKRAWLHGEQNEWFPDGALQRRATQDGVLLNWISMAANRFTGLVLGDPALFDAAAAARLPVAEAFALTGRGVTTTVLSELKDFLRNVRELDLSDTGADASTIPVLASLPALAVVCFEENAGIGRPEAEDLARRRPGLKVELEGERVP